MSEYHNNSIFWVETEKIGANPFQPRREFNQHALEDLADSIRQYGILQPLVVTRKEEHTDNGVSVFYELIAGERRLRASRIAGLEQVPVIIRKETSDKVKLELSIIENLQREDLNPIDRALAFEQLYKQFELTHAEIGKKMGKSRVYVSNSLRLLSLPDSMKQGLMEGRITEGHTRPLLMLSDKPAEQDTLYREIMLKKMSVRESEKVARSIAQDRVRKKKFVVDPRIRDFEKRLSDNLGTRVHIEQKEKGGKITIDYFSVKDLESILSSINKVEHESGDTMMDSYVNQQDEIASQKILSQSGPINFMSGEIKIDQLKKEPIIQGDVSEKILVPEEQNISSADVSNPILEISPLLEIKKLNEYVHHLDEEIVEYKESLPEYKHNANEEVIVYKEPIIESVKDVYNSVEEISSLNSLSEYAHNIEAESIEIKEVTPEYKQRIDQNIIEQENSITEPIKDTYDSIVESLQSDVISEIKPFINQSDNFVENTSITNPQFTEQLETVLEKPFTVYENISSEKEEFQNSSINQNIPIREQEVVQDYIVDNIQPEVYNQVDQMQVPQQGFVQNLQAVNQTVQVQDQYVQQDVYQNQQQDISQVHQNQVNNYQYQQPKKKGFFGRIFS